MSDQSLSLPGMTVDETGARRPEDARRSRFDPPRYFTTVHIAGYNVQKAIAAARRKQDRRHNRKELSGAAGAALAQPRSETMERAPASATLRAEERQGNEGGLDR